jgi:hypothetical protein
MTLGPPWVRREKFLSSVRRPGQKTSRAKLKGHGWRCPWLMVTAVRAIIPSPWIAPVFSHGHSGGQGQGLAIGFPGPGGKPPKRPSMRTPKRCLRCPIREDLLGELSKYLPKASGAMEGPPGAFMAVFGQGLSIGFSNPGGKPSRRLNSKRFGRGAIKVAAQSFGCLVGATRAVYGRFEPKSVDRFFQPGRQALQKAQRETNWSGRYQSIYPKHRVPCRGHQGRLWAF